MESQEFKKEFCAMAKQYGFKTAYGCCYKEKDEKMADAAMGHMPESSPLS